MTEERRPSYVLPAVLIIAGVVLLLDQLGIWTVDWSHVLSLWPLLLILLGLDILARSVRVSGPLMTIMLVVAVGIAIVLLWPSLTVGPIRSTDRRTTSLEGVEQASIFLSSGVADLDVRAIESSTFLLDGDFAYSDRRQAPTFESKTRNGFATIEIASRDDGSQVLGTRSTMERWQIDLSTRVPLGLTVNAGVGKTVLDLEDLTLDRLQVAVGVGETEVTLARSGTYDAAIDGGVGEITVIIPKDTPARVRVDQGLGNVSVDPSLRPVGRYYETPAYTEGTGGIEVDVDGGIGAIRILYR